MFATKSAQSLKNLFAGYHEPAALSQQQSQKLLNGLKASFRQHLDREYGRVDTDAAKPAKDETVTEGSRRSAANHHLRTVLSNPLFTYQAQTQPRLGLLSTPAPREPMDVFDQAVAGGLMNLKAATGVLMAKRKQFRQPDVKQQVDARETADRVLRWLKTVESHKGLAFLDDRNFVHNLVAVLIEADLESVAWGWLAKSMSEIEPSTDSNHPHSPRRRSARLLTQLVGNHKTDSKGNPLDHSIAQMLQVEKLFAQTPSLNKVLLEPWRMIAWMSTVEAKSYEPPSKDLFEAHLDTADRLPSPLRMEKAHLHLHHPGHPSAEPAVEFFHEKQHVKPMKGSVDDKQQTKPSRWVEALGRDTIESLLRSGKTDEADEVTMLLKSDLLAALAPLRLHAT